MHGVGAVAGGNRLSALLFAIIPALSTSTFKDVDYQGHGLLEILDSGLINVLLPLAALGIALAVSKRLRPERLKSEFLNDDSIATLKLYSHWRFALKWLAPGAILLSFAVAIIGFLRSL